MSYTKQPDMRMLLKRIRTGEYVPMNESNKKKDLNMRDMLKITRKLNEEVDNNEISVNKETSYDQKNEENKITDAFKDLNVTLHFGDLVIFNNKVTWSIMVDGIVMFSYTVTPDENTSGVDFEYTDDFSPENPDNKEIIDRINSYYNTFYKYMRDNVIQL